MSLRLIMVGKRHCRVLYIIPAQPELILLFIQKSGHGSAVSLRLIMVGKRHCRVLYIIPAQPELILLLGFIQSEKLL